MKPIYALVMAAGMARRFGRNKLLESIDGEPLLSHHLRILQQVMSPSHILVVLGHQANQLTPLLGNQPFVIAEHYQQGLGHSISAGVQALALHASAVMITLADQWCLTAQDYRQLIEAYQDVQLQGEAIPHCAYYQKHCGVPAIFPQRYFPVLQALSGDQGARAWLDQLPNVRAINLPRGAWDLDRAEDLNPMPPNECE